MERIPVGATIGAIYNFAIENFWRVLGMCWLAIVLRTLLSIYFILPLTSRMQAATAAKDFAAVGGDMLQLLAAEAFSLVLFVMLCVGVTRLALGHKPRWPFLYVALGRDFWRLLLSVLVFSLLCFVLLLVAAVVAGGIAGLVGSAVANVKVASVTPFVIAFLIYGLLFAFAVRLGLLLAPVIVTERGVGLGFGRSWNLSRGNFWRLLAVLLAVLLPLVAINLLELAIVTLLTGDLGSAFASPGGLIAWSQGMSAQMRGHVYIYLPLAIAVGAASYGIIFGAGAFAYRALVPALRTDIADTF